MRGEQVINQYTAVYINIPLRSVFNVPSLLTSGQGDVGSVFSLFAGDFGGNDENPEV